MSDDDKKGLTRDLRSGLFFCNITIVKQYTPMKSDMRQ